jgi:hypothetical protein
LAANGLHESTNSIASEARRRSAAEVERVDGPGLAIGESKIQLSGKTRDVFVDRNHAPNRDGEIAIGAAARAERDVDVDVSRKHLEI